MDRQTRLPHVGLALAALLLSTVASLAPANGAQARTLYQINGRGFGHGVGMSQWGAYGFAKNGFSYEQILPHYYRGTRIEQAPAGLRTVRVLVKTGSRITVSSVSKVNGKALNPARRYQVRRKGSSLVLRSESGRRIKKSKRRLKLTGPRPKRLHGRSLGGANNIRYRGYLVMRPASSGSVQVVNIVRLENYLRGVVPSEVPSSWPEHALRAQAVAARSYALATRKRRQGFDQYADTRSQVYLGMLSETPATDLAVAATRNEIVTVDGKVAATYFFSTSGGRTENIERAWPGSTAKSYLKSVDDPYDTSSPYHRWGPMRLTPQALERSLGGQVRGRLKGIRVSERWQSGRVASLKVFGSSGTSTMTGPEVREALGLRSTWFYIKKTS